MAAALQGQAAIQTKMVFTPATLNAKFHRRLVEAVEKRHVKAVRVRCFSSSLCFHALSAQCVYDIGCDGVV